MDLHLHTSNQPTLLSALQHFIIYCNIKARPGLPQIEGSLSVLEINATQETHYGARTYVCSEEHE